ncbi:DUF397 domain-containing protein [uncultured Streptomyces sp.]|uniref:DUF397 domain-containing protein n=1 Tax=uncultured Streptomyces sp. TaxID=174707 RepID=UPI00261FB160|nr:DUF397 domain-containing protein [uncultured Streptomyces sp.]
MKSEAAVDRSELSWFKSSYSGSDASSDCVEVASTGAGTGVHVRDSKNVPGPQLGFGGAAWADFVAYTSRG